MNLRPLLIDGEARRKAQTIREFADQPEHWYAPGADVTPPGDDPRYCGLFNSYRAVYSITVLPLPHHGLLRHLSASVPPPAYPNPMAVFALADLFGFTGWDGKSLIPPLGWMIGLNEDERCAIIAQEINEP